jgi:hypothetical protein
MSRGRKPKYSIDLRVHELLLLEHVGHLPDAAATVHLLQHALDHTFEVSPTWNHRLARDIDLQDLDLPSRANTALAGLNITTVGQLMQAKRTTLLDQPRLGKISLDNVCREVADLLWPPLVGNGSLEGFACFADLVADFVRRAVHDERRVELALGRLAPGHHRAPPLRGFGQERSLSRERIRQIVDDAFSRLGKPAKLALLRPFWAEAWSILQSWGRPIPLTRLAQGLRRRLGWADAPHENALGRLLAFQPELTIEGQMISLLPMDPSLRAAATRPSRPTTTPSSDAVIEPAWPNG